MATGAIGNRDLRSVPRSVLDERAHIETPRSFAGMRWMERLLDRIEHSTFFDRLGEVVGTAFVRVVRPGPFKDFLSGSWVGHPAHPALTDLPIGAWTSAFVLDFLPGDGAERASDALIGMGVATALPTAITGLSDLADVTESDQRALGAAHATGNFLTALLYGGSYLARRKGSRGVGVALSAAGVATATASALLGGHLAYRKGVGVDQTAFEPRIGRWTRAMREQELADGTPRVVTVEGVDVLFVRRGSRIDAIADRCSHRGGPLHEGEIDESGVVCPWHQSRFAWKDGSVLHGPATAPQPSYEVRVSDGTIEIRGGQ